MNISDLTKSNVSTAIQRYVLAPVGFSGIAGFVLDVTQKISQQKKTNIGDHYTENGSFIGDNVTHEPAKIEIKGLISEISVQFNKPKEIASIVAKTIGVVATYLPLLTEGTQQLLKIKSEGIKKSLQKYTSFSNVFSDVTNVIDSTVNFAMLLDPINPSSARQARAMNFFSALQDSNTLISIVTPWGFKTNMLIESLNFSQDPQTKDYLTDIEINLKEYRIAKRIESTLNSSSIAKGVKSIASEPIEKVATLAKPVPVNKKSLFVKLVK